MAGQGELSIKVDKCYTIWCPFCLNEIKCEDVLFRASHDIDTEEDKKLAFFKKRHYNEDISELPKILNNDETTDHIYLNGVLVEVSDQYYYSTRDRVCPFCHNSLPKTSGRQPVFVIPVVGAKGSGKSSYISALVHNLNNTFMKDFYGCFLPPDLKSLIKYQDLYERPVYIDKHPPTPSNTDTMSPIICEYRVKGKNSNNIFPISGSALFMFYDFDVDNIGDPARIDIYKKVFLNASAMIYIIDASKIADNPLSDSEGEYNAVSDLKRWMIYFSENFIDMKEERTVSIPTAIVMTKTDLISKSNKICTPLLNITNSFWRFKKSIDIEVVKRCGKRVKKVINSIDGQVGFLLDMYFSISCYFAVSSCSSRHNIDMPFLWLMYRHGMIKGTHYTNYLIQIIFYFKRNAIFCLKYITNFVQRLNNGKNKSSDK
jgi:GTPase SAR1 family protein